MELVTPICRNFENIKNSGTPSAPLNHCKDFNSLFRGQHVRFFFKLQRRGSLKRLCSRVRKCPEANSPSGPTNCYRDPEVLQAESDVIFKQGWAGLAHVADVPNKNDVKVRDFLGMPLIVVRDSNDNIRVFHNVCRHRGMILVPNDTNTRVLRCRYHSWTYGLDGSLRQAPHVGGHGETEHPDFDASCAGLKEVRSAVMFGTVFINLSGDAEPFEDFIKPVSDRWANFVNVDMFAQTSDCYFSLDVACNWKLAVENYCEAYHLPFVHPELNKNSRLEDHYNIEEATYAGQGSLDYNNPEGTDGRTFPNAKNLDEFWGKGAEYLSVFPNVLLGAHKDHFFSIVLEPITGMQTREHIQLYYFDKEVEGEDYAEMRAEVRRFWNTVFKEDVFAVEACKMADVAQGMTEACSHPSWMDQP